jgi:hypothetical protein
MAKIANELDLTAVKAKLTTASKKHWEKIFSKFSQQQKKVIDYLYDTKGVNCHIFAGSITFRIGKGSVKNLAIKPAGFKGGIPSGKTATDIFLKNVYDSNSFDPSSSVDKFIVACAYYFLIHDSKRVFTESDKTEQAEGQQVLATQSALKAIVKDIGEIRLKIGDNTYQVDEFAQYTKGRPKADATFKYKGKDVVWLSLKKGTKPGDFQQYGGPSDLGISGDDFGNYADIEKFANDIQKVCAALGIKKKAGKYDFWDLAKGSYFGAPLKTPKTAAIVMFGKDFGTTTFGINNCNCAIDGDIVFKKTKHANVYELTGEYHISVNPYEYKTPKYSKYSVSDIYSPVLMLVKADNVSQIGFGHARFYIWPQNTPAKTGMANLTSALAAIDSKDKNRINALKEKYIPKK